MYARIAIIVTLGFVYAVSVIFLIANSRDFIEAGRLEIAKPVTLPVVLDLSTFDMRKEFSSTGISGPGSWGAWTDGRQTRLRFKVANSPQYAKLRVRINVVHVVLHDRNPSITVAGSYEGVRLFEETFTDRRPRALEGLIPYDPAKSLYELRLDFDNPISPFLLGTGGDRRLLGIGISSIEIDGIP